MEVKWYFTEVLRLRAMLSESVWAQQMFQSRRPHYLFFHYHFPMGSIFSSGTVPFRLTSRMVCLGTRPETSMTAVVWMTTEMPWQALLRHWASRMSPSNTVTLAFVCSSVDTKHVLGKLSAWVEISWHRCQLPRPSREIMVRRQWEGRLSTEGSINTQKSECSIFREGGSIYIHPIPL